MKIAIDRSHATAANTLVVAFTGVSQGLGGIPFEFHRSLSKLPTAALYIRDLAQAWYQGEPSEIASLVAEILETKAIIGARRLVMIGNSMGGFGALLYGALCDADEVVAFAPQTAIAPDVTESLGDRRWLEYQQRIASYPFGDLAQIPEPQGRVSLVYGADDLLDEAHVDHLAGAWPIFRLKIANANHNVSAVLRDSGELMALLASAA